MKTLRCCFPVLAFCLIIQGGDKDPNVRAQNLDEVLSGFDEPSNSPLENAAAEDDDVFSGFDDPVQAGGQQVREVLAFPEWFDLGGSVGLVSSVNFTHSAPQENQADFRGLSMLRTSINLEAEVTLGDWKARLGGHGFYDAAYALQGRDQYTDELLDLYEQELEFDEVSLAGKLTSDLDIKIGRQIVVWGKSDNIRVTDILNPLDNRIPGMVDIKNRRLPVAMTRLDYYAGPWNISPIVVHEVRFDKNPVYNSDFFPGSSSLAAENKPGNSLENQQYALALNGIFSGWDMSLYGAWVFDPKSHLVEDENGVLHREHNRIFMGGASANIALGNWLLKGEAACFSGLEYSSVPEEEFTRLDMLAGIEYTGFAETVISLEVVDRHLFDFDRRLGSSPDFAQENEVQTVAKLVRDFANDTVQVKLLVSVFGTHGEDGAFERFQVDYDLSDDMVLTGGVVLYQSGDRGALSSIEDNDRLFLELNYYF